MFYHGSYAGIAPCSAPSAGGASKIRQHIFAIRVIVQGLPCPGTIKRRIPAPFTLRCSRIFVRHSGILRKSLQAQSLCMSLAETPSSPSPSATHSGSSPDHTTSVHFCARSAFSLRLSSGNTQYEVTRRHFMKRFVKCFF